MSEAFSLKILAADKVFYDGEAESVIVPAMDGRYQILSHHEDVVVATIEGLTQIKAKDQSDPILAIVGIGFIKVENNKVTMLVDSAEAPEDIDMVRAQEAYERAQEQLRQDQSIQEYRISKAALARAMMRLSMSNKNKSIN